MSMEPLPHGFGEFSMPMTDDASLASLWPLPPTLQDLHSYQPLPPTLQDLHSYQSVTEVKQKLGVVTAELQVAREQVRHKEQNIASRVEQIRSTVQERDLLRQQQHLLLDREMEASATPTASPLLTSSTLVATNRAGTFDVPNSTAVDRRSTAAAAIEEQHLLLAREMEASATPTASPLLTSSTLVATNRAATFAVPSSALVDHRSTATVAIEMPSFAAHELLPVTSSRASATPVACPLRSSSSSQVAVAMIKPFTVPDSAAVVNTSRAAAMDVPSFAARELPPVTSSRTSATPAACPLTSSSSSQVAVDPAAVIKPFVLPSSAAVLVDRRSMAKEVEVPSFAGLVCEDRSTAMALEMLAARRPLPQQGRLVQAVMEACPLLQNLLVAGPLPQWRNPPPSQALADAMIPAPSGSGAPMVLPWPLH